MPDRDQHVDRLLREAMAGPVRAESADCLDVDTLAAWAEGSLDPGHRARAESHAATCTRCQSMLAAMIRTAPIPAAAPASSPFRKWLVMLGPAVGVAAAVALWFAVDPPSRPPQPDVMTMARSEDAPGARVGQEERKVGAEPSAAQPQAPGPPPAPTAVSSFREREAEKALADADRAQRRELDALSRPSRSAAAAKKRDVPSDTAAMASRADAAESARVAGALPAEAAPPPPPAAPRPAVEPQRQSVGQTSVQPVNQLPPPPMQQQNATQQPFGGLRNAPQQNVPTQNAAPTNQTAAATDQRTNEKPAAAPPTTITTTSQPASEYARDARVGGLAAGRGGGGGGAGARGITPLSQLEVPSPVPLVRYRVVDGRTIQRSDDGGATWTTGRTLTPPVVVVAGACPSPAICWLAATGGVVLTTADGVTWREGKVSEPGEIKSIAAVDALIATVTMTDGRALTTTNGGTSWARPR